MVSVVLVSCNGGPALVPTIRALLEQTCRPMEIVVVDNGSACGTAGLRDELGPAVGDPLFVVVRLAENGGVGAGRNAGARVATGETLVWMDDDCRFADAAAVEGLAREFRADPRLGVRAYPVRELRGRRQRYLVPRRLGRLTSAAPDESAYFLGAACAMRAAVFRAAGMFDESLFYQLEELELSYRFARERIPIRFASHPVVIHDPRGEPRERRRRFFFYHTRNRVVIARRCLPAPVAAVHLAVWLTALCLRSTLEGRQADFRAGLVQGVRCARGPSGSLAGGRLDRPTLRWMARRGGRVWF
jgi:GT2 family glycosyltransferase